MYDMYTSYLSLYIYNIYIFDLFNPVLWFGLIRVNVVTWTDTNNANMSIALPRYKA